MIQYVREKFTCRDCEKISQAPAPFHVIRRGWAGPSLLAMLVFEKFGQHQPLNRQAERYTRKACRSACRRWLIRLALAALVLAPIFQSYRGACFSAARVHGDDTTVPVLAKGKTDIVPLLGLCPAMTGPSVARQCRNRDRRGEHPQGHLAGYSGVFQADAFSGYNQLYEAGRSPGLILEAACWAHARRKFFELADSPKPPSAKPGVKKPRI